MPAIKDTTYHSRREKHGIGKVIKKDKWVHFSALDAITEDEQHLVQKAITFLPAPLSKDTEIIVKVNIEESYVVFAESPDWNTATEPIQGRWERIAGLDTSQPVYSSSRMQDNPMIYHHKWMFVKDDYPGFDVKESMEWSETWKNCEIVKKLVADPSTKFYRRIGRQQYWHDMVLSPIYSRV
jgi:hypothetical protein